MRVVLLIFLMCYQIGISQDSKIVIQSAHAGHISLAEIDNKNNVLVTYGSFDDKSIKFWDINSGIILKTLDFDLPVTNISIDTLKGITYISDKNGIIGIDNQSFKTIKTYPIKHLKNFVFHQNTNLIYLVYGESQYDGPFNFYILNPESGKLNSIKTNWPSQGYPMRSRVIDGTFFLEFSTNYSEKIFYDISTKQFSNINSNHVATFNNFDLLYVDILDETHVNVIRYNGRESRSVWERKLEVETTKLSYKSSSNQVAITPDGLGLWIAPSKSKLYELNSEDGTIKGVINTTNEKTNIIADNDFVYALERTSNSITAPGHFNKYRRYSDNPITTYGYPIFNVNKFKIYKNNNEKGLVFSDLTGNIGSVVSNSSTTQVLNYLTKYNQKFSLYGDFYTNKSSKDVIYSMTQEEGLKTFSLGNPVKFKQSFLSKTYQGFPNVNLVSNVIATQNKNSFSIYDLTTEAVLFSSNFNNVKNVVQCQPLLRNSNSEVAFLINDEVVFDQTYKRRIDYYNYKTKTLLWQKEGDYDNLFFIENQSKILALNIITQQIEILNLDDGSLERSFSVSNISYSDDISINPSEELLIISGFKKVLRVYNLKTGKKISETDKFDDSYTSTQFMTNNVYVMLTNGHFRFYNIITHEEILRLYVFLDGEWLAHTPKGLFEGSQKAWSRVVFTKGAEIIPLDQIFTNFYTPKLISSVLDNQKQELPEFTIDNLNKAPKVTVFFKDGTRNIQVDNTVSETETKTKTIKLSADAFNDTVKAFRLYHNGKRVDDSKFIMNSQDATQNFTIDLVEGENEITAVAINSQNTESLPRKFIVKYKAKKGKPKFQDVNVHLLTIGIDVYRNPKYNLNYAVADATGFKTSIEKGINGIISKVIPYEIKNKDANKENIIETLKLISKSAKPEDIFIFYYAGHGVMTEETTRTFFLVPHDVTQLYGNEDGLQAKGISANELKELSKSIAAQKQLFVLDACQSGGALNVLASRGAAEEKAIAQLARSTGTHWLTASGSEQYATEFTQLGHGVFTYALIEALAGKADNGDSRITVNEIKAYLETRVPEISEEYKGTPQFPSSFGFGQDFPVSIKN